MNHLLWKNGIDTANATVSLTGDVDSEMYEKVFKAIHELKDADYITFVLNTEGGDVSQGFAIYDLIKHSAPNAKMVCVGEVMSAGVIILLAGRERVSYPNTQFLIHYGIEVNDSGGTAAHNARLNSRIKDIIEANVNVKRRTVNSWFKGETYFDAGHALKVGLINRVVGHEL